ncbi:hypothetical protein [Salinimicrobium terrae]|uniref:hypothetical protein n=1 Tax=Salinimicrobium terrae TaxID=470866 RepID=UPI00048AC29E|nr:hypothetical protein [Salinimicrobium terrae]
MEDSKAQQRILNLGRAIVNELDLDPGVDTLSKWMAHYIAEKLDLVEITSGKKKEQAQKECVDIILKLWEHRWSIPQRKPFLEDFEPLLETLKNLDPKKELPFFLPPRMQQEFQKESQEIGNEKINYYQEALKVDRLARSIINDLLNRAVSGLELSTERREIIRRGLNLLDAPDMKIIRYVLNNDLADKSQEVEKYDVKHKRSAELKKRIEGLEEFSNFNDFLLERYNKELVELEQVIGSPQRKK